MQIEKEKAINLISLGLVLKYVPLITLAVFVENINTSPYILYFLILGLFLLGYTLFIQGCRFYTQSKGYSSNWGWLGLLSIFCLLIILLIPVNRKPFFNLNLSNKNNNNPFNDINIIELFLLFFIAIGVVFVPALILYLLDSLNFPVALIEESSTFNLESIFCSLIFGSILIIKLQESGLKIPNFINFKNNVSLKLILFIAILEPTFGRSFHSLVLYKLSFIFPGYVESYLNEKYFTNVGEALLWSFYTILLAPLIDELLFHGIILQKWSIKWGVKSGIITTSLLFAVFDFSFDIIPLFIRSILYSILYFKTRNLLAPILCQTGHNTITTIVDIVNFFSKSTIEREFFISASDYQASLQPLLGQIVFLIAITATLLGHFIYKNFPKNDAVIPSADNRS
ncbi:CPBP family intramembrane glutamic endopeptidase [Chlorogloea sp. CCALA 695]|uniref:CPBP family intramembrane glutamic endopeptidase n=1 Tax=Chlorogloea sp. CCALA 695 TaxID=2107693 RepID=UPI000D053B34|nr:type II CAAX endopeptidase family protein [Chlorogloea sp. CCALA 695]PSB32831.1 hypothetical protein C7B70_08675 [Chlorogloea sp. CCALA 695]